MRKICLDPDPDPDLDPDPDWDFWPDPGSMNTDPKHCLKTSPWMWKPGTWEMSRNSRHPWRHPHGCGSRATLLKFRFFYFGWYLKIYEPYPSHKLVTHCTIHERNLSVKAVTAVTWKFMNRVLVTVPERNLSVKVPVTFCQTLLPLSLTLVYNATFS